MLDDALLKQLRLAVFRFIGAAPEVDTISALVGLELAVEVPKVDRPFEIAVWIVEQATRARTPELLIRITREVDVAQQLVALHEAIDALEKAPDAWLVQRSDQLIAWGGTPFVARKPFRDHLAAFDRGEGPACLVVRGGQGDGKTYLRAYCQQLEVEGLRMGWVEVRDTLVKSLDARDVAVRLAQAIGVPFKSQPREHESADRWAENLATWLVTNAPETPRPALVILDGFDHRDLPAPLHTFVLQLVQRLQEDPDAGKRLRLILLGYDNARLEEAELEHEAYVLEYVDRDLLVEWFKRRHPNREEYEYTDSADLVLENIPKEGPDRMQKLCTFVATASEVLK